MEKKVSPVLTQECDIPKRDGDKVIDYVVSESRMHNALVICNLMIKARNNELVIEAPQK